MALLYAVTPYDIPVYIGMLEGNNKIYAQNAIDNALVQEPNVLVVWDMAMSGLMSFAMMDKHDFEEIWSQVYGTAPDYLVIRPPPLLFLDDSASESPDDTSAADNS